MKTRRHSNLGILWMAALLHLARHQRTQAFLATKAARSVHSSTPRYLNRFLFDPAEVDVLDDGMKQVTLPKDDYRTIHASKILGLHNGDTIRAGLVGDSSSGLMTDSARICWIPEGKVKKAEPLANGNPPGSLHILLSELEPPPPALVPSVSLILALPRPLQLGRMLPMIAQMGVDKLVLTQAQKVPKDYFGSHLFRKPNELRDRLIEGLCQAGDVRLPQVTVVRSLRDFLRDELDDMFPVEEYTRVLAHPQRKDAEAKRMRDVVTKDKVVVAVGPEGGWEEPLELDRFAEHQFEQISMGSRILRSDCAVVSLLSLAHDCVGE